MAFIPPIDGFIRTVKTAPVNLSQHDRGRIPAAENAELRLVVPTLFAVQHDLVDRKAAKRRRTVQSMEEELSEMQDEFTLNPPSTPEEQALLESMIEDVEEELDDTYTLQAVQKKCDRRLVEQAQFIHALGQVVHHYSYDKHLRDHFAAEVAVDLQPWYSRPVASFKVLTGGWDNEGFLELCDNLPLLPASISTDNGRWTRRYAIFMLHYRWTHADSYDKMQVDLGIRRCRLIKLVNTSLKLMMRHYHVVVACIDIIAILPDIEAWNNILRADYGGAGGMFGSAGTAPTGEDYVIGVVDGSAKKTGSIGRGERPQCVHYLWLSPSPTYFSCCIARVIHS